MGRFQTINYSHMYSGVPCLTVIPCHGFVFNSDAHEVLVLELRSRCLSLMVKYELVLVIIMSLFSMACDG